jgi:predicted metallopeptidase
MKYFDADDLQERMIEIVRVLGMEHVKEDRVKCIRSQGSSTRRTLARCHALGKVMQHGMKQKAHYTIEFLEPFEKLDKKEQDKVIIHELMHIPKAFGGGFRHHDFVCDKNVEIMHEKFENLKGLGESKEKLPRFFS